MKSTLAITVYLLLAVVWLSCDKKPGDDTVGMSTANGKIDFNFQVKPILSDKCFACHGPDAKKRQADFRLDGPQMPGAVAGLAVLAAASSSLARA